MHEIYNIKWDKHLKDVIFTTTKWLSDIGVERHGIEGEGAFEWWVDHTVHGYHSREGGRDTGVGRSSSIKPNSRIQY